MPTSFRHDAQRQAAAAQLLAKAAIQSADLLGLHRAELAKVISMGEKEIERVPAGTHALDMCDKSAELAALLVQLCRALDVLKGSDDHSRKQWMRSENTALGAKPCELITTADGLACAVRYLQGAVAPL